MIAQVRNRDPRQESAHQFPNNVDPVYVFLDRIVFDGLFRPKPSSDDDEPVGLDLAELEFLVENLLKHRKILWCNIILATFLHFWGLESIAAVGDPAVVVSGLLAPAMVTGAAWYTVSFGGIPEKFVRLAVVLTLWMFLAFSLSMTLLTALLCSLTPWPIGAFVLMPIYVGLYLASMWYDNIDGLKIGLDSTLLKFSRASLNYYQKHGLITRQETQSEVFGLSGSRKDQDIALFSHYINMLEKTLVTLDAGNRSSQVANHLIASTTDLFFRVIELSFGQEEKRAQEYDDYVANAHRMSVGEVDEQTIGYLRTVIKRLGTTLNTTPAAKDISLAERTLTQFENIRKRETHFQEDADEESTASSEVGTAGAGDLSSHEYDEDMLSSKEDGNHISPEYKERQWQQLSDYLFSQVFHQLLSLIKSHREIFLSEKSKKN